MVDGERRRSQSLLHRAIEVAPDSAKYHLLLSEFYFSGATVINRVNARDHTDSATRVAERMRVTGPARAAIEYRAARKQFESYVLGSPSYRVRFVDESLAGLLAEGKWSSVEQIIRDRLEPIDATGEDDYVLTEQHLRRALAEDATHVDAAGLFAVLASEHRRWPEVLELTRRLVDAACDSGRAWAVHGLALTRIGRWRDAANAFDRALRLMSDEDRWPYEHLGFILRAADNVRYQNLEDRARLATNALYWELAQPLLITDSYEVRTEYYARVTYAVHRWSDPLRDFRGYDTDIGAVYIRYGPPDVWAAMRGGIVWIYESLRTAFTFQYGWGRAFHRTRERYRVTTTQAPARFDNVPLMGDLDTILAQPVRFRGDDRTTDLALFTWIPVGRMVREASLAELGLTTAVILRTDERELARQLRRETLRPGDSTQMERRTWRLALAPSTYYLRLEAHVPAIERAARGSQVLPVPGFSPGQLALSDVLLASRVAPRDSTYRRWTDFLVEPNAGRFDEGTPVALLWEIYNLTPDSTGRARYTIELWITVEEIERYGFAAAVIGGIADAIGLSAEGDDAVAIAYERDEPTTLGGAQVEYIEIDLEDAPPGRFTVELIVRDHVANAVARAATEFVRSQRALVRERGR